MGTARNAMTGILSLLVPAPLVPSRAATLPQPLLWAMSAPVLPASLGITYLESIAWPVRPCTVRHVLREAALPVRRVTTSQDRHALPMPSQIVWYRPVHQPAPLV